MFSLLSKNILFSLNFSAWKPPHCREEPYIVVGWYRLDSRSGVLPHLVGITNLIRMRGPTTSFLFPWETVLRPPDSFERWQPSQMLFSPPWCFLCALMIRINRRLWLCSWTLATDRKSSPSLFLLADLTSRRPCQHAANPRGHHEHLGVDSYGMLIVSLLELLVR